MGEDVEPVGLAEAIAQIRASWWRPSRKVGLPGQVPTWAD